MLVTQNMVALRAGVSQSVVSRFLAGLPVRYPVLVKKAVEELGYDKYRREVEPPPPPKLPESDFLPIVRRYESAKARANRETIARLCYILQLIPPLGCEDPGQVRFNITDTGV